MFIGHWAPAFAVAARPKAPALGLLMVAAQLIDWAFFSLLIMGVERMRFTPGISAMNPLDLYHMPYTHSLLGAAMFGAAFAGLVWMLTKDRFAALLSGAVVVSHWFLDLLVHVPDLTLLGSPPKLGLGLWNHPWIEMPLELGLTFGALWLYVRAKRPAMRRTTLLVAILLGLQLFNWFGTPEPEVTTGTSILALTAYALVTLAAWWMGKSTLPPGRLD
ncbi:MAG: hypothetical protein J0M19_12015 [Sphingomonadales bacterium]|nr:hypothetical protein [Sphingomonadales bacterium]